MLDPDVVVRADFGASRAGVSRETRGARAVAEQAMLFRRLAPGARPALVNGTPGFVVFDGDRPYAVLGVTVRGTKIAEIDILADPDRLEAMDLAAFGA